jgi:hypothetical protein
MRWKNGDWIQGEFENDRFLRGRGKRMEGGEVKDGMWKGDEFIGHFEGQWSPDEPYSKGIVRYIGARAGEVYEGERKYAKRHGQGKRVTANGKKWEGEWKEGELQRGRITEPDGDYYEGTFAHNKLNGEGKCVFVTQGNTVEEGLFKKHGDIVQGKRIFEGGVYEGGFTTHSDEEDDTNMCISYHGFGVKTYEVDDVSWRYEGMGTWSGREYELRQRQCGEGDRLGEG